MNISTYNSLPNNIWAYWVSNNLVSIFNSSSSLSNYADVKQGLSTADNDRFLRLWFEVSISNECFVATDSINAFALGKKWFAFNKGGEFRKWYGNQDYVINWNLDGEEIKKYDKSVIRNPQFYFLSSISWSKIATNSISFRIYPKGFIFDSAGCSLFPKRGENNLYFLALLNSKIIQCILNAISPTINYVPGQIELLPIIINRELVKQVNELASYQVNISETDFDSFEESWNFKRHPLI